MSGMSRGWVISVVAIFALSTSALAADNLPKSDPEESFEIEPPVLIPNRDAEPGSVSVSNTAPVPVGLERLERDFERSKRSAGGAEHLFKIGVLAKMEVEQRTLRMIRLEADVENARLTLAKEEFALVEKGLTAGEVSKEEFHQAESALAKAISVAHAAAAKRDRAEIEVAESNLHRQQKLLSLGSGRKAEVARAEQKLAELKAQKN
jgi:hypothetical protein